MIKRIYEDSGIAVTVFDGLAYQAVNGDRRRIQIEIIDGAVTLPLATYLSIGLAVGNYIFESGG